MPTIEVSEETLAKIKEQLGGELKEINSMEDLIGETYCFQCARYIYHGTVSLVNESYITLKDAGVVFETGEYSDKNPKDLQKLPNGVKIMRQSIEAFFKLKW